MIHICPNCGQSARYVSRSNVWFCDKCGDKAEPQPLPLSEMSAGVYNVTDSLFLGESEKFNPSSNLTEMSKQSREGRLLLEESCFKFISKNAEMTYEIPLQKVKWARTLLLSMPTGAKAAQTVTNILVGLAIGGVIGAAAMGASSLSTPDNVLEISFVSSEQRTKYARFLLHAEPRVWVETLNTIILAEFGRSCRYIPKNASLLGEDSIMPQIICLECGSGAAFKKSWGSFVCEKCDARVCPTCGNALRYVPSSGSFFCVKCKMEESELFRKASTEATEVTSVQIPSQKEKRETTETKIVYCYYCGVPLPMEAVYCRKCGKSQME